MKQDKFLIGILAGIVLLVIVAVVVVLSRTPGSEAYRTDNSPEAVVHNYFLAVQRKDYEKAHSYLSDDLKNKPNLDQFIIDMSRSSDFQEFSLKIGEVFSGDQHTQVTVSLTSFSGGNIFESGRYTTQDVALLRADAAGNWKLIQFPYPYWGWAWNEAPQ